MRLRVKPAMTITTRRFISTMQLIKKITLLLAVALGAHTAPAQDILIKLSLDRDSILVGDQVDMTLDVSYNKAIQFSFPALGDTLMPGVEILRSSKIDTLKGKKNDDLVNVQRRYTLTSFDGGIAYSLPQISFTLNRGAVADTFTSNRLTLKVAFPPMDSTFTPNDIKPPVQYPITFMEVLPYVGAGLLLLALVAFLIYYIDRRRKNKPVFFKPKPKEPAHVVALRELDKVKKEQLWQHGKVKDFYTRLSEIIRTYIEDRYSIQAMEQTSDDILRSFDDAKCCDKALVDKLREMFYISDLAKFAKYTPQPDENEMSLANVYLFVERTKQELSSVAPDSAPAAASAATDSEENV